MNRPTEQTPKKRQEIPIHLPPWLIDDLLDVSNKYDLPAKNLLLLATTLGLSQLGKFFRQGNRGSQGAAGMIRNKPR